MDVNLYLLLALLATLLVIAYLLTRLHRVRGQLCPIGKLYDLPGGTGGYLKISAAHSRR